VIIESKQGHVTAVKGDPDHPANKGLLCSKGSSLHLSANIQWHDSTRILSPMARGQKLAPLERLTWTDAMKEASNRFTQTIQAHGPDSVGFYISGQLLTEDYYVFNKLAKGLIGTNNIDTNSRLCMSSAVAAYKWTLGADAPPACYEDLDHAQCLFIAGSNMAFAHPILFRRIERAKARNKDLKIIVVDPRLTDTASGADLHLAIQAGTDVMLFNGMLHIMLWEGWIKAEFIAQYTQGFEDLKATLREYTPQHVARMCGITESDLFLAARWFAQSTATLSLYCQGLNQSSSGTDKNAALINLHLATAHIGKPGAGPLSLTGQPNAMGGREVGGMANLLSAHRDLANPLHRAEVASLWGVKDVPSKVGKTAVELFQAAADGEIKALWIACTNPAQSMPDQKTVRRALERCEFVVVQEAFMNTETVQYADLLLPASTWAEKEGTVTNSERCISRVRAAKPSPGESMADWQIVVNFARALESNPFFKKSMALEGSLFPYDCTEQIWNEHRLSTQGRDLDITGLTYAKLEAQPQQWPFKPGAQTGQQRLYEDFRFETPTRKAQFANVKYRATSESRESKFPFSLNTGRLRDQWHGMSRTGLVSKLFGAVSSPVIELNQQDMVRNGWLDGDLLKVTSKRGSLLINAKASAEMGLNQAFIAMHWGEQYLSGRASDGQALAGVNALTTSSFCEKSKQPELKHAAVHIAKAQMPWSMLAVSWVEGSLLQSKRQALQSIMKAFDHAYCLPFGQERMGLIFRASCAQAPPTQWIKRVEDILSFDAPGVLKYEDAQKGIKRSMIVSGQSDPLLTGFMLVGHLSGEAWLGELLRQDVSVKGLTRHMLQGKPPSTSKMGAGSKSEMVCTCIGVSESQILDRLQHEVPSNTALEVLTNLQSDLKCGTSCGSCVPQIKRMIASVRDKKLQSNAA
jgi:assimilatory nitrate reductase catalytic subunit